jgi:hypothetical protein
MKNFNNLFSRMKTESIATLTRMWRYAAMMALLLTLGVGEMWG